MKTFILCLSLIANFCLYGLYKNADRLFQDVCVTCSQKIYPEHYGSFLCNDMRRNRILPEIYQEMKDYVFKHEGIK